MRLPDPESLRIHSMFRSLTAEQLRTVTDNSRMKNHGRGHLLFLQGDPAPCFFLVLEGWVTVYRDTPDGDHTVIHVVRPGETFAEPAALNLGIYPASAEAATDCKVLEISATTLKKLLTEDPSIALRVIGQLSQRLRFMVTELERFHVKSAPQRLACFLVELSPHGAPRAEVVLPFDKTLIAARLGMKPESLSRALARLRKYGVRANRGHNVELSDLPLLRDFCRGTTQAE